MPLFGPRPPPSRMADSGWIPVLHRRTRGCRGCAEGCRSGEGVKDKASHPSKVSRSAVSRIVSPRKQGRIGEFYPRGSREGQVTAHSAHLASLGSAARLEHAIEEVGL